MCYKAPGPRCSKHSAERLARLENSRNKTSEELRSTYNEYRSAVDEFKKDPDNKTAGRKAKNLHGKARDLKAKHSNINESIRLAQRDYDGTKKGQKELKAVIANFDKENGDINEYAELTNRLSSGKMLYSWRKNKLELQEEEKRTGTSTKSRRGKFLTMADRNGENTIEVTPELIDGLTKIKATA